ncbi:MAG: hypothetical protein DWQ54_13470 [Microcystis flos-aquae TF09]|uniref:Uncharacterized protein n=1 Tax=Microcystis flos-aquae TF09 TaxID=2060473 RepID=A0A3E0L345_9CHRO|nr:MAG: hypothetical protein DWQ54_13470 [Microcystis flos-aquae TF09]
MFCLHDPPPGGFFIALYSLEKLIEWKLSGVELPLILTLNTLYSLEKLIEWKPLNSPGFKNLYKTLYLRLEIN